MKKQKTDYKWIDLKRERETTENPVWWLKGCLIILGWFGVDGYSALTDFVYKAFAIFETLNYQNIWT